MDHPKLGIWAINQRFNIKGMSAERAAALDRIGFLWNHIRKNRSQKKWDPRYEEHEFFRPSRQRAFALQVVAPSCARVKFRDRRSHSRPRGFVNASMKRRLDEEAAGKARD